MKLQYPPLSHYPSMYCLHFASPKSVTGLNSTRIGLLLYNFPFIDLRQFSAYSSVPNFKYKFPSICSPILSATIISKTSPYLQNSMKTSS